MPKLTPKLFQNQSFYQAFIELKDPRVGGRCLYPLMEIIPIALCALICGANGWEGIALFANKRKRFLSGFLPLSNSIPSADTFARMFDLLSPKHFKQCFQQWVNDLCVLMEGDIIAIDGKIARGSGCQIQNKKAIHILNAFSTRHKLA